MSKYFQPHETACRCGCLKNVSQAILDVADILREEWGSGLRVTSGARCENYTKYLRMHGIPAATRSAHIEGIALDLKPVNGKIEGFQEFVQRRLERLGIRMEDPRYTSMWVHIDLRPVAPGKSRVFIP